MFSVLYIASIALYFMDSVLPVQGYMNINTFNLQASQSFHPLTSSSTMRRYSSLKPFESIRKCPIDDIMPYLSEHILQTGKLLLPVLSL
jgi:hypothetical protein